MSKLGGDRSQRLVFFPKKICFYKKRSYQWFLLQSSFAWYIYFVPKILFRIVYMNKLLFITSRCVLQTSISWSLVISLKKAFFRSLIKIMCGSCGNVPKSKVFSKHCLSCLFWVKKCYWKALNFSWWWFFRLRILIWEKIGLSPET